MKKLVKRSGLEVNSVRSFKKCSCSCRKCEKWYVKNKSGVRDINKLM